MNSRSKYVQCRLCLYKNEYLSDIFEDNGRNGFTAAEVITDLLQLKVSKMDEFPQLVCLECMDKLIEFKNFKQQCENAKSNFEKNIQPERTFDNVEKFSKSESQKILEKPAILFTVLSKQEELSKGNEENSSPIPYHLDTLGKCGKKVFKCSVCRETFFLKKKLTMHMKEHIPVISYPCNICGKEFETGKHLTEHKWIHSGDKPHACKFCSKCFTHASSLKVHVLRSHKENHFQCRLCLQKFKKNSSLLNHMKVHGFGKPFECDLCDKKFKSSSYLVSHKLVHSGEDTYKCNDCGRMFYTKTSLLRHTKCYSKEGNFSCNVCEKRFVQKYSLIQHMMLHTSVKTGQNLEKSNLYISKIVAENTQSYDDCCNDRGNGTTNSCKGNHLYHREKNARVENTDILEEPKIPFGDEIKEEELIITNDIEEDKLAQQNFHKEGNFNCF